MIGSGFGGLAAAVRLRARGYEVLLLEALPDPGGRARVFRDGEYVFDAGPTVITAPWLLDELFELVGRDPRDFFELLPVDPLYQVRFPDGSVFDYAASEEALLEQIRAFNPRDVDGYRRLAAHARRIFDVGFTRLADHPFHRFGTMARTVPDLVRLGAHRTVYDVVARYMEDERLRRVFSFEPLLVGGSPFRTSAVYLLIHTLERRWGVHYARGGTGAIVAGLIRLLEEIGADVRLGTPARRITTRHGAVTGVETDAGHLSADVVVSNADPGYTYDRLVDAAPRRGSRRRRQLGRRASFGLFVAYFGMRNPPTGLEHHTILMGPRYRGLLADIYERAELADDFSLYLHAPAVTDPGMAPPGRGAFYVLSPVPNNASGVDWIREGPAYRDRILDHLDATVLPGLGDRVEACSFITPRYFERELRSPWGAAFGPEPTLTQSAWFRYHNRSPIEGLFFVGAGTHPGAGLPGVLSSARLLERLL